MSPTSRRMARDGPAMSRRAGPAEFTAVFPLKREGHARLVGTVRDDAETPARGPTWDDVSTRPARPHGHRVERVNWFSTYRVHHRVADHFRPGTRPSSWATPRTSTVPSAVRA